jgi:ABC-2 type transport system permease protein
MYALFNKELSVFFSSLTGYMVIMLYLLVTGLFLWVIPGSSNVIESGYASLDSFFSLSPWLFMFSVPAVTMRLFPDDFKSGTIELLLTKPITEGQIVMAKYLASLCIVVLAMLPTLVYFGSVYWLGNPAGNIDAGGTWGSYFGLLLMASLFVGMGIFTSALTNNQIVAFLAGIFIIFVFYVGFEMSASLLKNVRGQYIMGYLGVNQHYRSLGRGVIDTRDVVYFVALTLVFIKLAQLKLQSRKW